MARQLVGEVTAARVGTVPRAVPVAPRGVAARARGPVGRVGAPSLADSAGTYPHANARAKTHSAQNGILPIYFVVYR
jgi:hypothetical protein